MEYVIETYIPHTRAAVTRPEMPGAYGELREAVSATVTCRAGQDTALPVAVGDDYCYVNLQHNDSFYVLAGPTSGDGDHNEILLIGGVDTSIPARHIAECELGFEVLRKAPDIPRLLAEHVWEEQRADTAPAPTQSRCGRDRSR